uniref:Putative secreted protein n=1 Tax=Anopheles marajoara TaxID=58244 RepID=A0A2M4CF61_9DIPT
MRHRMSLLTLSFAPSFPLKVQPTVGRIYSQTKSVNILAEEDDIMPSAASEGCTFYAVQIEAIKDLAEHLVW